MPALSASSWCLRGWWSRGAALVGAALCAGLLSPWGLLAARSEPSQVQDGAQNGAQDGKKGALGYQDTPLLPGGKWHVHDGERPQPRIVTPGTFSTEPMPGTPPSDAIVLFDGKDLSQWTSGGGPAKWKVENGCAEVNGTGDVETRASFGDCQLHLEFSEPVPASGESQGRGNSGVYFMQRYEVQVLDCFGNQTYPDGQTAGLYGQCPPLVNACRKPGEWQVYDIAFEAPRFEAGKVSRPARVTVFHNGVLVHHAREYLGATGHRILAQYSEHAAALPLKLQDHGNPVRYRNIWVRPLQGYDQP